MAETHWDVFDNPTTVTHMDTEPIDIVEAGYDSIADRYLAWIDKIDGDPRLRFLDDL